MDNSKKKNLIASRLTYMLLVTCLGCSQAVFAVAATEGAKNQLSQLEARIIALKNQLVHDQSEKEKLYKALATIEKEMSDDFNEIHLIKQKKIAKQDAIQTLTRNIEALNETLKKQQQQLANHVLTRHKLGVIHPWQYLLSQNTIADRSRLFIWYHYLFQADQKLIANIQKTTHALSAEKALQKNEKIALSKLEKKHLHHQTSLLSLKSKQQQLINALDKQIQSRNQQLISYRDDKVRLQQLLNKLNQTSPARAPIIRKTGGRQLHLGHASLDSPLRNRAKQTKALNQGLVFLAQEGTPVLSVLPGKVVFSDWLRGYGLLLIIDHGDGLMSLYAHNASLFARVGTAVKQGEEIATVGHTGGLRENGLYFEVRRRGRAIPPREWMS